MKKQRKKYGKITKSGHRSKFEDMLIDMLKENDINYGYEPTRIKYIIPAKTRHYTPDVIIPNPVNVTDIYLNPTKYILFEFKGRWIKEDRDKHLSIKESNPTLDIRFVFQNHKKPIYIGAKTNYGEFCDRNDIMWYTISEYETFINNYKRGQIT